MFCMQCGTELPDGAKFCFTCGTPMGQIKTATETKTVSSKTETKLVDAKCTNCGAKLEVDPNMKRASCSFCGAEFIVDQAINNYNVQVNGNMSIGEATINVHGIDKKNLLMRAKDFETNQKYDEAIDYYNRVLDIDFEDTEAKIGIQRIKINRPLISAKACESRNEFTDAIYYYNCVLDIDSHNSEAIIGIERVNVKIKNFVYYDEEIQSFFGSKRKRLMRDSLVIIDSNGAEEVYYIEKMQNVRMNGSDLQFYYPGKLFMVKVGGKNNNLIYAFICNVFRGVYPPFMRIA